MYLGSSEKLSSRLGSLPPGPKGVEATLNIMRTFVRHYKKVAMFRDFAAKIIAHVPQKEFAGEVNALHEWVRDHIRYMRDIRGVETVQTPVATLRLGYGDCDDKATLLAAMLEATGHPSRFVAVGRTAGRFEHVYVETLLGRKGRRHSGQMRWVALDTTEPQPMGWRPDNIAQTMRVHN